MYRLGIIEESIDNKNILCDLASYFVSQRIEDVPGDEYPIWHINEYRIPEQNIWEVLDMLKDCVRKTWYIHAFSDKALLVVLWGRWFEIALERDESWDDMIAYGVKVAEVEQRYLESIPLHV